MFEQNQCTKAREEKTSCENNPLVVGDRVDVEAKERPAGDHVHRHPGHDGDGEERVDSMEN